MPLLFLFISVLSVGKLANSLPHAEYLQIAGLFRSNAREHFESDHHFITKIKQFEASVKDVAYNERKNSHPLVVRYREDCTDECHGKILQAFGEGKTTFLSQYNTLVTASVPELNAFALANPDVVQYHIPMLPDMKIEGAVRALARHTQMNCIQETEEINTQYKTKDTIKSKKRRAATLSLRIVLSPLLPHEVDGFLSFTHSSSWEKEIKFEYNYAELQKPEQKHYLEVTLSACEHSMAIATMFAERREVMWIERIYPVYTHNRWANGICDTADASSKPLQNNAETNFTGHGDVIAVADTGIDAKNCYFRDANVEFPYVLATLSSANTVSHKHRKLVQYYYQKNSDKGEDFTGHGTHTAGSKYIAALFFFVCCLFLFCTIW